MKIAVYSGTFDPITNGHMSIIKRAVGLFDKLYIAVAEETYKHTLFTVDERVALVQESVADLENVEAEKFTGLLVDYASARGAVAIVRGLRVISDFEYEMQMASFNRHLNPACMRRCAKNIKLSPLPAPGAQTARRSCRSAAPPPGFPATPL